MIDLWYLLAAGVIGVLFAAGNVLASVVDVGYLRRARINSIRWIIAVGNLRATAVRLLSLSLGLAALASHMLRLEAETTVLITAFVLILAVCSIFDFFVRRCLMRRVHEFSQRRCAVCDTDRE